MTAPDRAAELLGLWLAFLNDGDVEALRAGHAPSFVDHDPVPGYPETLEGVSRLTFEDDRLTEVRTDVVAVAGQLSASMQLGPEEVELLSLLQGATVQVVFGFADHGDVATVTDVEATTMAWDRVLEFFRGEIDAALE